MEESTSREKVLKRVRNALIYKKDNPYAHVDFDSPIYKDLEDLPDVTFARELTKVGVQFVYCEGEDDLVSTLSALASDRDWHDVFCTDPSMQYILTQAGIPFQSDQEALRDMKVGVTGCEYLIARLGSVMISSRQDSGRRLNVYPEIHIIIAYTHQLVEDLKDAIAAIREKYTNKLPSLISVITGPSRTADIEKTLVMGAHGPKELFVFFTEVEEDVITDEET